MTLIQATTTSTGSLVDGRQPEAENNTASPEVNVAAKLTAWENGLLREPVTKKLVTLIVVLCVIIAAVGSVGLYGLRLLNTNLTDIADVSVNRLRLAAQVQQDILAVIRAERNVIISDDAAETEEIYARLTFEIRELRARLSKLSALLDGSGRTKLNELETAIDQWLAVHGRVLDLSRAGSDEAAFALASGDGRDLADRIEKLARGIADSALREIDKDQLSSKEGYDTTRWLMIAAMLLGLVLATAFGARVFIDIGKDFQRRRRAEADLRGSNALLAQRSADLVRTNDELEQFAYVASHDLKAPLRAIDNLAAWIAEDLGDALEEKSARNMELLRGRVHRLELLLDDILMFSRAGRVPEDTEEVDLGELLSEVVDLAGISQDFAVRWPEALPVLRTARTPLQQVLTNLIGNAVKHHDRQTGTVDIAVEDNGPFYEFAVTDDGPGIPPQFHERVFQMFQSLKPRDKVEGSGMGLAIVKKLIVSQGGEIRIDSQDGVRGTTFRFDWPKVWGNSVMSND